MVFISFHLIPQNCIWSRLWCRFSANLPGLTNLNTMSKLVKWPRGILLGPKGKLWSSKSDLEKLAISLIVSFTEYGRMMYKSLIFYNPNHIPNWCCLIPQTLSFCKRTGWLLNKKSRTQNVKLFLNKSIIYLVHLPKHAEHLECFYCSVYRFPW